VLRVAAPLTTVATSMGMVHLIEFILIVVLLLLIGIVVRREVFKW
jgi:hypothetical protein